MRANTGIVIIHTTQTFNPFEWLLSRCRKYGVCVQQNPIQWNGIRKYVFALLNVRSISLMLALVSCGTPIRRNGNNICFSSSEISIKFAWHVYIRS